MTLSKKIIRIALAVWCVESWIHLFFLFSESWLFYVGLSVFVVAAAGLLAKQNREKLDENEDQYNASWRWLDLLMMSSIFACVALQVLLPLQYFL